MGLTIILVGLWLILCSIAGISFIVGRHWRNEELLAIQLENIHLRGSLETEQKRTKDLAAALRRLELADTKEAAKLLDRYQEGQRAELLRTQESQQLTSWKAA